MFSPGANFPHISIPALMLSLLNQYPPQIKWYIVPIGFQGFDFVSISILPLFGDTIIWPCAADLKCRSTSVIEWLEILSVPEQAQSNNVAIVAIVNNLICIVSSIIQFLQLVLYSSNNFD